MFVSGGSRTTPRDDRFTRYIRNGPLPRAATEGTTREIRQRFLRGLAPPEGRRGVKIRLVNELPDDDDLLWGRTAWRRSATTTTMGSRGIFRGLRMLPRLTPVPRQRPARVRAATLCGRPRILSVEATANAARPKTAATVHIEHTRNAGHLQIDARAER